MELFVELWVEGYNDINYDLLPKICPCDKRVLLDLSKYGASRQENYNSVNTQALINFIVCIYQTYKK